MKRDDWQPADDIVLEENAERALRYENNALIIAGPGAGKTELLAQKACYLLQTGICAPPHRILAVSFKVDSATNLADRVEERCGSGYRRQFTSVTFDAFAKSILDKFRNALPEQYRPTPDYVINDDEVMRKISDDICGGDNNQFRRKEKEECQLIALGGKGNAKMFLTMINNPDGKRSHLTFSQVFSLALYILRHNPLIAESIRRAYKFVFIDEFQDTTALQYRMIKTLFDGSNCTLTAVGDNKQRIMLWAGAMKNVFEKFQSDFDATMIPLLRNYRSAPRLVELQARMYKSLGEDSLAALPSDKWLPGEGEIKLIVGNSEEEEAQYLVQDILNAIDSGIRPEEICILSKQRIEKYAKLVMAVLEDAGVESRLEAEYQDILSDPLIRLLIDCAYASLEDSNPKLRRSVKDELLDLRGFSETDDFTTFVITELELNDLMTRVGSMLKSAQNVDSLDESLRVIIDWVDVDNIYAKYPAYRQGGKLDQQLHRLTSTLHELLVKAPDIISALDKLLGKGVIPIMTIHKSKGLEYQNVYFLGLEDGAFWSFKKQPEEDRCAFFVALSRAKASVTFTFSNYRLGRAQYHNEINEFYTLLQSPGAAQVITY